MQRGIPGQDGADHAEGIAAGIDVVVGALVDDLAVHDIDQAGVELEVLGGKVHQRGHLAAGLAGLGAFQLAQAVFAAAHDARQFQQDAATLGRAHVAPGGQRVLGGLDRQLHFRGTAVGDFAQLLTGARVELVDIAALGGWQEASADVALNF
ncbi:hypothetical protein D9M70_394510 [compost metagenome]